MEPIRCPCRRGGYTNLIYFRRSGLSKCPLSWSAVTSEPPKAFQHSIGIVSCHLWSQTWRVTAARDPHHLRLLCFIQSQWPHDSYFCAHLSEGNFPQYSCTHASCRRKDRAADRMAVLHLSRSRGSHQFWGQTDGDDRDLGFISAGWEQAGVPSEWVSTKNLAASLVPHYLGQSLETLKLVGKKNTHHCSNAHLR